MSAGLWRSVPAAALAVVLVLGAGGVQAQDQAIADPDSVLGVTVGDLVYTPVAPCRIADTRQGGGALAPGTVRDFKVTGSGLQGQGGNPLGCGVPLGPARSAIINFVAVNPSGAGNLRTWAYSEPPGPAPTASIINFTTGVTVANGLAVSLCDPSTTTCSFDIKIQADGSGAHLVADVVGYFSAPASPTVPWSAVTAKPPGFADNVDNDTQYFPGFGLQLVGTTFSAVPTVLQRRLSNVCNPGNSIRAIDESGLATCEPDDVGTGDITEIITGPNSGLTGGVTSGAANLAVDPTDFNAPIDDSHSTIAVTVPGPVFTNLREVTITVPAGATSGGHVAVMGAANGNCGSSSCTGQVGWSDVPVGVGEHVKVWGFSNTEDVGSENVTAIDQFTVAAPGSYTFYLVGNCTGGICIYDNMSAVAFFIPR
jgi:hypothetical protein